MILEPVSLAVEAKATGEVSHIAGQVKEYLAKLQRLHRKCLLKKKDKKKEKRKVLANQLVSLVVLSL
ncbi:MAG: hypothetical protein DWQ21_06085 [Bacteroidetes bacterium]|nr:MAG: hypothetical protein DWQ21_06085 [Bacteroidota bacterium]